MKFDFMDVYSKESADLYGPDYVDYMIRRFHEGISEKITELLSHFGYNSFCLLIKVGELEREDDNATYSSKIYRDIVVNPFRYDLIDDFNQKLAKISKDYHDDPEMGHYEADQLMVDTLKNLGFDLQAFEDIYRWYS